MRGVHTVIIPAAGLGTRFLPFTKTVPKALLPLGKKPAIQWITEEAAKSNLSHLILVTSRSAHSIENHFDAALDLRALLPNNAYSSIDQFDKILQKLTISYVRQPEPLGLGDAILRAQATSPKDEYSAIMLPDDIIIDKTPCMGQLIRMAHQERASIVAVQEVPAELVSSYGIIAVKKQLDDRLFQVGQLVEKPTIGNAPSRLAIVGRYVVSPKIFGHLQELSENNAGELQLTDALTSMVRAGERVIAYKISGTRYDIGTQLGWMTANVDCTLTDPDISAPFKAHLQEILD